MKSLQTFINERVEIFEAEGSKTITFDFTDLENGEETLKSLKEKEGCKSYHCHVRCCTSGHGEEGSKVHGFYGGGVCRPL